MKVLNNIVKAFFLLMLGLLVLHFIVAGGYFGDFLDEVPFGGEILSVVLKVFQQGTTSAAIELNHTLNEKPFSWFLNEVLHSLVVAMFSAVLSHLSVGRLLWYTSDKNEASFNSGKVSFINRVQYFICDVIAVIVACVIADWLYTLPGKWLFPIPRVVIQLILIFVFALVDILLFAVKSGRICTLSIRAFFFDIFKNVCKLIIIILIVVSIYAILQNPSMMYSLVSIILLGMGIGCMLSGL